MARAEIDVGPIPPGIRAVVVDYRLVGESAYVRLGETGTRLSQWDVDADSKILIRARFRDASGIGAGIEAPFSASMAVADRPAMTDLDVPAPYVTQQDGATLLVTQDVPDGSDPREYSVEVVQAPDGATAPKDGLHGGHHAPGEEIPLNAWPGDSELFTRLVRLSDGLTGDWATVGVSVVDPLVDPASGHSTGFAGGTIGKWGGAANPASMEVTGGDLLHKAIYAGDIAGFAGDLTDIYAGDMGLRWPGRYTTANIALAANESIQISWKPTFTSVARPVFYAGDWWQPAGGPPRFQPDGSLFGPRTLKDNLTAGGMDEVPVEIEVAVATSPTASPTFVAADFKTHTPGKVYADVNTYAVRFDVKSHYGKVVTIDRLDVWHRVWCRARPWHTHSDAGELIYEFTAGADLASLTATIAAQDWDELRVEVDWKNADASPSQFLVRFNNDSGSNYYKDGAAAATSMLCGGGTLVAGWYERVMFRLARVKSGLERMALLESGGRWSTTDSEAPDTPASVMWDNTADAISTIVFAATVGATPLASGSTFRIWGRRHHDA